MTKKELEEKYRKLETKYDSLLSAVEDLAGRLGHNLRTHSRSGRPYLETDFRNEGVSAVRTKELERDFALLLEYLNVKVVPPTTVYHTNGAKCIHPRKISRRRFWHDD